MSFPDMGLEQIGAHANAHYKAGEKANQKAGEHATSAGMYLAEAKRRLYEVTPYGQQSEAWERFLTKDCPAIKTGRRRADQLIAHATGKKPIGEVREQNCKSKQEARVRAKAVSLEGRPSKVQSPLNLQPPPEPDERDAIVDRIMAKLAKLSIEQILDVERIIPTAAHLDPNSTAMAA